LKLETLLHADVDFRSTNNVEGLIGAGSAVPDAGVPVHVSVSVSILQIHPHSWNSNWSLCYVGLSSSSSSPRKLIPIDRGSPYATSRVEVGLLSWMV